MRLERFDLLFYGQGDVYPVIGLFGEDQKYVHGLVRFQPLAFMLGEVEAVPGQGENRVQSCIAYCAVVAVVGVAVTDNP